MGPNGAASGEGRLSDAWRHMVFACRFGPVAPAIPGGARGPAYRCRFVRSDRSLPSCMRMRLPDIARRWAGQLGGYLPVALHFSGFVPVASKYCGVACFHPFHGHPAEMWFPGFAGAEDSLEEMRQKTARVETWDAACFPFEKMARKKRSRRKCPGLVERFVWLAFCSEAGE